MKKVKSKTLQFHRRKNLKRLLKLKRKAVSRRHRQLNVPLARRENDEEKNSIFKIREERFLLKKKLFTGFDYASGELKVPVKKAFGIEISKDRNNFLDIASKVIDFNTKELKIDLEDCTRVWPSGVMLFCSLIQWAEFNVLRRGLKHPAISSIDSNSSQVNGYLTHCGFHDYVQRPEKPVDYSFSDDNVVKIERETSAGNEEVREVKLRKLLFKHTKYSPEDIELFDSKVLTELFLNVSEHGITQHDRGWWFLAQFHPTHKIISLNVADNGVGFRHSLMTGPQRDQILRILVNDKKNDGDFIKIALEENVSGAFDASTKEGLVFKNYKRGARRGNGLDRIRDTCSQLGIKLSILSHYGYVFCNEKSEIVDYGSRENRIFGGTLYHFSIPCDRKTT